MTSVNHCSACGCELPADAPAGLCPKCLLAAGFESGAPADPRMAATTPPPSDVKGRFVPPSADELNRRLPQYEFLELLGQGGMGSVHKARQKGLDRIVAVKVLPAEISRDAAFAERFAREARALAKLSHPNIVAVYDFGQASPRPGTDVRGEGLDVDDALFFIVMEYVDGVNLRQAIRAKSMAPEQALAVVPQICDALQFAHDEGVVHRDIKPENILVDRRGRVKIADFGLAKMLGGEQLDAALTGTHQVMGTLRYMAPEQMEGTHDVDHRADIYSLGVVFYELLTGELPIGRFAPPSKKVQIDVRLDEVVLRALEKEPELRWQHAEDMKTEMTTIVGSRGGVMSTIPAAMLGREYRSRATLFGLPLLHIAFGLDPQTGEKRVAKGIIAIGDVANGVVALGGMAYGVLAFGGLAIGLISFGGLSLGLLFAVGGMAIGGIAWGGGAVGAVALGGFALGGYAFGGAGYGVSVLAGNAQDAAAKAFFEPWAYRWPIWMTWLCFGTVALNAVTYGAAYWLLRRHSAAPQPPASGNMATSYRGAAFAGYLFAVAVAATLIFGFWRRPVRNEFLSMLQPTSEAYKQLTLKGEFYGSYATFGAARSEPGSSMPLTVTFTLKDGTDLEAKTSLPERRWPSGPDAPVDADALLSWMKANGMATNDPQTAKEAEELNSLFTRFSLRPPASIDEWDTGCREDLKSFGRIDFHSIGRGAPLVTGSEATTAMGVFAVLTAIYLLVAFGIKYDSQEKVPDEPRFSRTAIVGAVWAPCLLLLAAFLIPTRLETSRPTERTEAVASVSGPISRSTDAAPDRNRVDMRGVEAAPPPRADTPLGFIILGVLAGFVGATSPFATTILGAVSIAQIRRSAGRLYGLPLAVADVLFFPLLILDGVIFFALVAIVHAIVTALVKPQSHGVTLTEVAVTLLIALPLIAWIDFLIVRAVWRAAAGNVAAPDAAVKAAAAPTSSPRWLVRSLLIVAIAVAAAIAAWFAGRGQGKSTVAPVSTVLTPPADIESRREGNVTYLAGHKSVVVDAAVSGDGKSLASADEQGFIVVRRIDDAIGGDVPLVLDDFAVNTPDRKPIHRLTTAQDGRRFFATGNLPASAIVEVPFDGDGPTQFPVPSDGTISNLFSFNDDKLLAYERGNRVAIYDREAHREIRGVSLYANVFAGSWQAFAVAPDREHFAVTWCNMVNMSSTEPYTMTVGNSAGKTSWQFRFESNHDWHLGQPVFTSSDTLVLCLPSGKMHRWTLAADGKWNEAKQTTPSPAGWFYTSTASADGRTVYLATGSIKSKTAPDGSKYDDFIGPYHVLAAASDSGHLLWKQELRIGAKATERDFTAEPINALVAVPGTKRVAAALWDGRVAIVEPPAEPSAEKQP